MRSTSTPAALGLVALIALSSGRPGAAQEHAVAPAPGQGESSPQVLDGRTPLPLTAMMADHQKRNMRDHLAAVQEIVAALAAGDLPAVERAARRIGYSDDMARMCQHMGAAAPGFTARALAFHRSADTIADAAQRGERGAVMTALAATLRTCVDCHASYRQEVVDDASWQHLTTPGR